MANVLCPVETHRPAASTKREPALGFERSSDNTPRILATATAVVDEGIVQTIPKGMEHLSRRLHHFGGCSKELQEHPPPGGGLKSHHGPLYAHERNDHCAAPGSHRQLRCIAASSCASAA